MYDNLNPSVVSEVTTPGAAFQIVDYHWDAGVRLMVNDPNVLLRWRVYPFRIRARGWIKPGEEVGFGRLMLHPADVPTHVRGGEVHEDVRTLVCRFDQDWLNTVAGLSVDWRDPGLKPCLDLRNGDIDHSVRRLMRELLEPSFATKALVEGLAMSTAVDIIRSFNLVGPKAEDSKGRLSAGRLRQIHEIIDSFTEGCPTLSDVAQRCGYSVPHLRRMFKASTGKTLHDFIEEVRVTRAKALLLESNMPLKVISHKLGFCHPSAFSFAFKKVIGEAPREFRNRYAKGTVSADN